MDDETQLHAAYVLINSVLHSDLNAVLYPVLYASAHQSLMLRAELVAPGGGLMRDAIHTTNRA